MGFKYAIRSNKLHFLTHTVVDWIDVFTRRELAMIVVNSMNYCIANKGLEVYVWCLMPSHLHMIAATQSADKDELSKTMRDFKKFTSKEIVERISEIDEKSEGVAAKTFSDRPELKPGLERGDASGRAVYEAIHRSENVLYSQ